MGLEKRENNTTWASIIADGSIRVRSEESNPNAVRRDYELKDGTKGTKWELVYTNLRGHINDISFRDGDYGTQLMILIDDITLAVSMNSKYADDILKKLPNVDFSKDVNFVPFAFDDDNGKEKKGVTIYQDLGDVKPSKLTNFFYDPETNGSKHGYPEFPENSKKMKKDDWKIYFITVRKFLQEYTEANVTPLVKPNTLTPNEKIVEVAELEIDVENIKFES